MPRNIGDRPGQHTEGQRTTKNEDFQSLARRHALDALKSLAAIAVDPAAKAKDREHARTMVDLRLHAGNDISPDLRREIENVLHGHR
jgi:hypothetical protein